MFKKVKSNRVTDALSSQTGMSISLSFLVENGLIFPWTIMIRLQCGIYLSSKNQRWKKHRNQPLLHHITFPALCYVVSGFARGHICILKTRFDQSTQTVRWSLPSKERCLCQGVVAPEQRADHSCYSGSASETDDLWFIDNPFHLVRRENWTPKKLDKLLERDKLCCKLNIK